MVVAESEAITKYGILKISLAVCDDQSVCDDQAVCDDQYIVGPPRYGLINNKPGLAQLERPPGSAAITQVSATPR